MRDWNCLNLDAPEKEPPSGDAAIDRNRRLFNKREKSMKKFMSQNVYRFVIYTIQGVYEQPVNF